ncbi:predicted protein [Sclerotinia sclerotiorum 1980 UF-70]|uniref:Uncharacterized protein n=2 Tax=Sclerotinia sclerotiorum (strain ATCC 18683 / 1980 / Ss-1) TaxID=665079 RepID=A7E5P0_SCLS1|nr:predicted protein [Sclerotinia sclerotiorum 1980 UF-70]APA07794.1 hypothetical protein sscle_03g025640 [Sclerotinia sclerotiorum 1980 UF-70]EDN91212.1 predicted protein [Sclerotinia sclerotiorum 1980 UF-70]
MCGNDWKDAKNSTHRYELRSVRGVKSSKATLAEDNPEEADPEGRHIGRTTTAAVFAGFPMLSDEAKAKLRAKFIKDPDCPQELCLFVSDSEAKNKTLSIIPNLDIDSDTGGMGDGSKLDIPLMTTFADEDGNVESLDPIVKVSGGGRSKEDSMENSD